MGFGDEIPKQGLGGSPIVTSIKKVVSEQNAKHSTIGNGFALKSIFSNAKQLSHLLLTPAMRFRVTPCGARPRGLGLRACFAGGERAPLGLRGLGEDFDFSPKSPKNPITPLKRAGTPCTRNEADSD